MFCNNIVKISEILDKWNLLKTSSQSTDIGFLHNLQPFLLLENWNFRFVWNHTIDAQEVMTKVFA